MTSVPKPLKFLRPHYPDLQALYETWLPSEDKVGLCLNNSDLVTYRALSRVSSQTFCLF